MIHAAVAKVAATAVLAGGAVAGVSATESCPAGQEATLFGCATVTHHPDEENRRDTGITSAVTVNVSFRDNHGNKTDSGISTEDQFKWLGGKKLGKNGDGMLIEVEQTTEGKGGWGSLYQGWIPVKYTQIPSMFK